jgi:DNA-binding MarR family transcriptional regulator
MPRQNVKNLDAVLDFPPKETAPYLIVVASRLITAHYMAGIERTGVAAAQTYVLRELMRLEPQSQVDLARNLEVSKASVGETLVRLERAGLIERRRFDGDRRVIMISLTQTARAMKEALVTHSHTQVKVVREILGPEGEEMLNNLLTTLADGLRSHLEEGRSCALTGA